MRSNLRSFRWLGLVAGSAPLAVLFVPSVAHANDAVAAQQLFEEGKQLTSSGHYAEACSKFEESQKADPGLGTEFHLADCWQHTGRSASAWSLFRQIESEAHARGEASRERVAHDRATALEPFLSKLAIVPKGPLPPQGLTVRRDGVEVGRDQWGVPVPVDPGPHTVSLAATGKQPWGTGIDVPDDGRVFNLDLPPLAVIPDVPGVAVASVARVPTPVPVPVPAPTTGVYPSGVVATARPPGATMPATGVTSAMPESASPITPEISHVEDRGAGQRAVGWALVGAGIAGLGAGAYFTVQWMNDRSDSNPHCNGNLCDATGFQLRHDATTQGRAAIIAGGSGLLSVIVGGIVIATAPTARVASHIAQAAGVDQIRLFPVVGLHEGGLGMQGNW
jgi:hypothetical protein